MNYCQEDNNFFFLSLHCIKEFTLDKKRDRMKQHFVKHEFKLVNT